MPEHETVDVDAAFARVLAEAGRTEAPGAERAMRTARRRRTRTAGLAAAAVLVTVAGIGALAGPDRPSPQPAGPPSPPTTSSQGGSVLRELPIPAPLTAEVLSEELDGGVIFRDGPGELSNDPYCLGATADEPVSDASEDFHSGSRLVAAATYARFADAEAAHRAYVQLRRQVLTCARHIGRGLPQHLGYSADRMEGMSAVLRGETVKGTVAEPPFDTQQLLWIERGDDRIAILTINGDVPETYAVGRLAHVLLAAALTDAAEG